MTDATKLSAEMFPMMSLAYGANSRSADRFAWAVETIQAGVEAGTIYNVDLVEAKRVLDYAVDCAENIISKVHLYKVDDRDARNADYEMSCNAHVSNLYGINATAKKLAKLDANHSWVVQMKALCAEAAPLAAAVASLKGKTIKGRKVDPAAVAARAAKLALVDAMPRATCGCCFSNQAVLPNGKIHDHGYTLPQNWMKTGSCYGRDFRPLEVSDEGPRYMVKLISTHIANTEKLLAEAPARTEIKKYNRYSNKTTVIAKGEPSFERELAYLISEFESDLRSAKRNMAEFEKVVAEWKPAA